MSPPNPATILLVDDSPLDLRLLVALLSNKGFRIIVAFDGTDGYRKAILKRPDLILLDVNMTGVCGFAACRMLKSNPLTMSIPVIFLTASNNLEDRLNGFEIGAVDYVIKPFSEQEVLARVKLHLEISHRLKKGLQNESQSKNQGVLDKTAKGKLENAAKDYLLTHLSSPPSPAQLARILGTNENRLNETFRSRLGITISSYVREERMRQARQLLTNTDLPIQDIGLHLGYSSAANFSTAFKERFGKSPRDFRQLRDNQN